MQGARLLNKARAEKNSKNRNKQTSDQEHEKKKKEKEELFFFFGTSFIQSFDIKFKVTSLKNGHVFSFCF